MVILVEALFGEEGGEGCGDHDILLDELAVVASKPRKLRTV